MRFLYQKHDLETSKFTFLEVDSELLERFRVESEEADEQELLQEARDVAVDRVDSFTRRVNREIKRRRNAESGSRGVDILKGWTQKRIFEALRSGPTEAGGQKAAGYFGRQRDEIGSGVLGDPNEYREFIRKIQSGRETAQASLSTINRATAILDQLREKYTLESRNRKEMNGRYKSRPWKNLKWNDSRDQYILQPWRNIQWNTGDRANEFKARQAFVFEAFDEVKAKMEAQKGQVEAVIVEAAARVDEEYTKRLSPEEQADLIKHIKLNQANPGAFNGSPKWFKALFSGLSNAQRLDVYKKLDLSGETGDSLLTQANEKMLDVSEAAWNSRKRFKSHVNQLKSKYSNLKMSLARGATPDRTAPDIETLADSLELFLSGHGVTDRRAIFTGYPVGFEPNGIQRLVAICNYLGTTARLSTLVERDMSQELKTQLLAYLENWDNQHSHPEADKVSSKFEELDRKSEEWLGQTQMLVQSSLRPIRTLNQFTPVLKTGVEDKIAEAESLITEFSNTERIGGEDMSTDEIEFLRKSIEKITQIKDALTQQKQVWKQEEDEFRAVEREWNLASVKARTLGRTPPTVDSMDYTVVGTDRHGRDIKDKTNEDTVKKQVRDLEYWETEFKNNQSRIAELMTRGYGHPPTEAGCKLTRIPDLIHTEIDFQRRVITKDRAERGRTVGTGTPLGRQFDAFLEASNTIENEKVLADLEATRQASFAAVLTKKPGSRVSFEFHEIHHGRPDTADNIIKDMGSPRETLNDLILIEKTEKAAVFVGERGKIVFLQESEEGKVILIEFRAPPGHDVLTKGIPPNYDPGKHPERIGSPARILPA